jgi:hypothetical protein
MSSPIHSICIQDSVHLLRLLMEIDLRASIELTAWQGIFSFLLLKSILDIRILFSI